MSTVVIVGGGYAGLAAARGLARRGFAVTLIERRRRHELLTVLPAVVAGQRTPEEVGVDYRRILRHNIRLVTAEAHGVDLTNRSVATTTGVYSGDWLIVAAGAVPGFQGIPGARVHGYTVRSVADAVKLRAALLGLQKSGSRGRITVIGAGYTGTEIAGELASWSSTSGNGEAFSVTLIAADLRLLAQGHVELGAIALEVLRRKEVVTRLGALVSRVDAGNVVLRSGEILPHDLLVWAAPSEISSQLRAHGADGDIDGRYPVNEFLQVIGERRVYAAGDIAVFRDSTTGSLIPSSGQLAVRAGAHIAKNVIREAAGLSARRFHPQILGEAISLGDRDGVADVFGLIVTGRAAVAVKEAALQRYVRTLHS